VEQLGAAHVSAVQVLKDTAAAYLGLASDNGRGVILISAK
jgi:hypothetical protein